MTRNMTRRLSGRVGGPSLEPPFEQDNGGRIDDFIAKQSYAWLRDMCDSYRIQNRLRGWRRVNRFSAWLRDRVEEQLIIADDRANAGYY